MPATWSRLCDSLAVAMTLPLVASQTTIFPRLPAVTRRFDVSEIPTAVMAESRCCLSRISAGDGVGDAMMSTVLHNIPTCFTSAFSRIAFGSDVTAPPASTRDPSADTANSLSGYSDKSRDLSNPSPLPSSRASHTEIDPK